MSEGLRPNTPYTPTQAELLDEAEKEIERLCGKVRTLERDLDVQRERSRHLERGDRNADLDVTCPNCGGAHPVGECRMPPCFPAERTDGWTPPADFGGEELVGCLMEVYARSCTYGTRALHDRWVELRAELLRRLALPYPDRMADTQPCFMCLGHGCTVSGQAGRPVVKTCPHCNGTRVLPRPYRPARSPKDPEYLEAISPHGGGQES